MTVIADAELGPCPDVGCAEISAATRWVLARQRGSDPALSHAMLEASRLIFAQCAGECGQHAS